MKIDKLIETELLRQKSTINLIASENYASTEVIDAVGSILMNKYAEGYPGKRYYAGCEVVDSIELLAQTRCKKLFNAEHANVQPHSGSQANMAVYMAALKPGDTILGMGLAGGGHLTHGHPINFSAQFYNAIQYGLNRETEQLDYQAIEELAQKHKPALIIAGASAYSRTIDFEKFSKIATDVGAYLMADIAHIAGLVATGVHPSPIPCADFVTSTTHKTLRGPRSGFVMCKQKHSTSIDKAVMPGIQGGPFMNVIAAKAVCFKEALTESFINYQRETVKNAQAMASTFKELGYHIVSGGTDNHLFILDLTSKNITGLEAEKILENVGITVSRSCIPFDTQKPWVASGIRIGTPAITTRKMGIKQAIAIAHLINDILSSPTESMAIKIKKLVKKICHNFSDHI